MRLGIVGSEGVVGGACKFGFRKLGHDVRCHDIALKNTKIEDLVDCEIIFICVPTPSKENGFCDISIVEKVVDEISNSFTQEQKDKGRVPNLVIKSTVPPGTTSNLSFKYWMPICFCPEFLRERCAITDFTENHDLLVIGTRNLNIFEKVKEAHGNLPEKVVQLSPEEAEFVKYFNNAYNATLITFANSFYEVCKANNVNYTNVKNAIVNRKHIMHHYLECNDNFRGFGGMCLPKDLRALNKLAQEANVKFFQDILDENDKYKTTVFEGMRDE